MTTTTRVITIPFKRGTTAQNDAYTGTPGEITIDSTKRTIRVHDGLQQGGEELLRLRDLQDVTDQVTSAQNAADAAAASADQAQTYMQSAQTSETNAATSAQQAADSAQAAANSEGNAATYASTAQQAATDLTTAVNSAQASATAADTSATDAAASAAAAQAVSRSFNKSWLGNLETDPATDNNGDPLVDGAEYLNTVENKIRVYSDGAWGDYDATAQSATLNAQLSATNAAQSEANALSYKNSASTSAGNAASSESNALSYKNAAETAATNASTSETNALSYKNSAADSATAAAASAQQASDTLAGKADLSGAAFTGPISATTINAGGGAYTGSILKVHAAANSNLEILTPNSGSGVRVFARDDAGTLNRLELQGGSVVFPFTSGADGLTFDAATGNLGLATTPNTWGTSSKAIQIGGVAGVALSSDGDDSSLSTNAYRNGATWNAQVTSSYLPALYNQFLGSHIWSRASVSATAGEAITWVENGRFDPNGNLLVGTSVVQGKLSVGGYIASLDPTSAYLTQMYATAGESVISGYSGSGQSLGLYVTPSGAGAARSILLNSARDWVAFQTDTTTGYIGRLDALNSGGASTTLALRSDTDLAFVVNGGLSAATFKTSGDLWHGLVQSYGVNPHPTYFQPGYSTVDQGRIILNHNTSGSFAAIGVNGTGGLWLGTAANSDGTGVNKYLAFDNSGNIGVSQPPASWSVIKALQVGFKSYLYGDGGSSESGIGTNAYYDGTTWRYISSGKATRYVYGSGGFGEHRFQTAVSGTNAGDPISWVTQAIIDEGGSLLVGASQLPFNVPATTAIAQNSNSTALSLFVAANSGTAITFFDASAGGVGSITTTATATSYNTTSDYRLKEVQAPLSGSLDKIMQIPLYSFLWKANGTVGEGTLAHLLQEVLDYAVTGQKDAIDSNGNPIYQGVDWSKVVPRLIGAVQELKQEFDSYVSSHP